MGLLLAGSRLDKVDCYYELFSAGALTGFIEWMGFYDPDDGDVHIPAVCPAGLFPWWGDRKILDVLRHEFGHALADKYRKFFRGGIFKVAFGASYGEKNVFKGGEWAGDYVSKYATTATQEDFAETFMLYMKYKGKLPARFRGKHVIEKKWKTVGKIAKSIAVELRS